MDTFDFSDLLSSTVPLSVIAREIEALRDGDIAQSLSLRIKALGYSPSRHYEVTLDNTILDITATAEQAAATAVKASAHLNGISS